VAIAFFLITNAVFYTTAGSYYLSQRLRNHGAAVQAMITHKWQATRWSDEVYIGYAYVDEQGIQYNGSARIREAGAGFYEIGEPVEVLVDREVPSRSALAERSHLSLMETVSSYLAMVVLTGIFCLFGWWLLVARIRRRWQSLRSRELQSSE
jgi:hypothetical protein